MSDKNKMASERDGSRLFSKFVDHKIVFTQNCTKTLSPLFAEKYTA
jgi:hypothetical protein